jgi:hypothetical protein
MMTGFVLFFFGSKESGKSILANGDAKKNGVHH